MKCKCCGNRNESGGMEMELKYGYQTILINNVITMGIRL